MSSGPRAVRAQLRTMLDELREAVRAHKRDVDRTAAEVKRCARRSRKTLDGSEKTLARLRGQPRRAPLVLGRAVRGTTRHEGRSLLGMR